MTSEVLMLNKDAVVIAADSAVTTGRDPHPRYSKAANKIFDLCVHGNVAVTIYAAAEIDRVPWELALKQFRHHDKSNPQRSKLKDYVGALIAYLQNNASLFPVPFQATLLETRFIQSVIYVAGIVEVLSPDFADDSKSDAVRAAAWASGYAALTATLAAEPYQSPISHAEYQNIVASSASLQAYLAPQLAATPNWKHANIAQLTQLGIEALVKRPTNFMSYTGLVVAGYGADEIFPSFAHISMYGHVGGTLLWTAVNDYAITHDNDAWIQPFAQSSMIDRFTDGFDSTLRAIIDSSSKQSIDDVLNDIKSGGIAIPDAVADSATAKRQKEFMDNWIKQNWNKNFHPLRRVLNSLSVSEMGHLAESLLVLEELRERVTSPTESVGGPIDVVVITKAEGLIWLKRKHFFAPELNGRYFNRNKADYN